MQHKNEIVVEGNVARISLTQGYVAIVSASDLERIQQYRWHASVKRRRDGSIKAVYANNMTRNTAGKNVALKLHRLVTDAPAGLEVDHIDGNGLNNTRDNLRVCTRTENGRNQKLRRDNTSGFKGVTWNKQDRKWRAQIVVNKNDRRCLGCFSTPEAAYEAYCKAAHQLHGDFARFE